MSEWGGDICSMNIANCNSMGIAIGTLVHVEGAHVRKRRRKEKEVSE
jgi:hypothetical protein